MRLVPLVALTILSGVFAVTPQTLGRASTPRGPVGPQPAEQSAAKRKVLHLKLRGDFDCMKLAGDLEGAIAKAKESGVDVVVLEACGDKWRGDVLLRAMPLLQSETPRVIVWLNDSSDSRVGTGQAVLGLVGARCYVGAKTEIVFEPTQDLREQAPAGTVWEQVDRDLQAMLWSALTSTKHARDPLFAAALPSPQQAVWAMFDRAPGIAGAKLERLVSTAPSATDAARSVAVTTGSAERGGMKLRIDANLAVSLGIADGVARDLGQILAAERLSPQPLSRAELTSGLPEARQRLTQELSTIDHAAEKMDKALDEAEKFKGMDAARRKAKVGKDNTPIADDAAKRLEAVEKLAVEYPELLRTAPPGTSVVELTPQRLSAAWHYAFQDRKTRLTELRARAVRLTE